ncbi:MAG: lysylphosphatidylglycerol synthase domain-containing protein [Gemmatimonadaceae bacterium]
MAVPRRLLFRAAQLLVVAAVLVMAARALRGQWGAVRRAASEVRLEWGPALLSGLVVLATYALLVDAWRRVANGMGGRLSWPAAARIWFVSNLARYAGSLFQIGALGVLAQRAGLSPVTAAGAAVVMTVVNLITGFAVVFATGLGAAQFGARGYAALALSVAALALAPVLTPVAARWASRLTGRDVVLPAITPRALLIAAVGSAMAWVAYGLAFRLLAVATLGAAPGPWTAYVSVYTASYLIGFLGLVPAGAVVAEGAMVAAFGLVGLLTPAQALMLAVVSRLWRTVLEILPGLAFAASGAGRARPDPSTTL